MAASGVWPVGNSMPGTQPQLLPPISLPKEPVEQGAGKWILLALGDWALGDTGSTEQVRGSCRPYGFPPCQCDWAAAFASQMKLETKLCLQLGK